MNFIIDAFNLGFKLASAARLLKRGDTELAIKEILFFLQGRCTARDRVIAVFDGQRGYYPGFSGFHPIEIKFSQAPQKADDIIRNFLRGCANAGSWTLVSSDHEIINTAVAMGAGVIKSENFIKSKPATTKKQTGHNTEYQQKYDAQNIDMEYWLKEFGKDK